MIEPNTLDLDLDNLNTAEALGFTTTSSHENPYIIPDGEENLSVLKKRPLATA